MLKVYNQQLEPLGILENAYDVGYEKGSNSLAYLPFSMPIDDNKIEHLKHFNFIDAIGGSGREYGKFRIMPTHTKKHENKIEYQCEHVFATLWDDCLDTEDTNGYLQFTNIDVRTILETILSFQTTEHWVLGVCDFENYITSDGFENENGLYNPFMSVIEGLNEPFELRYNTNVYPFVVDVLKADNEVKSEYRWGKDIRSFEEISDPTGIINYIVPKGYGEGINTLLISEVNNGQRFLKDQASIDKWGKKGIIKVDRRFKNASSLKAYGQRILDENKDPKFTVDCKAIDLSIKEEYAHERKFLNTVSNVVVGSDVYPVRIVKEKIADIIEKEYDVDYELGNKLDDISDSNAETERRQDRVEGYSKGNTTYDTFNANENCDPDNPVVVRFYLPGDLVNVNTMDLTYETTEFRAYSQATEGGGSTTETTSSGGSTTVTSASGGSAVVTSASGGSSSPTTTSQIFGALSIESETTNQSDFGTHFHRVNFTNEFDHAHTVNVPSHQHNVSLPSHQHNVSIPDHVHSLTLPDHIHDIKHGIYKLSTLPTEVEIKVDGTIIPQTALTGEKIDIIPYLSKDSGGRIQRDTFHEVSIKPDDLGRVNINIISRLFISSHVGGVY